MTKLRDLGEFGLIDRISRRTGSDRSVMLGIGDDAAVLRGSGGKHILFASDMVLEGVHFDIRKSKPFHIGWKAVCAAVSDIAAMGGVPRYACVSAGIDKKTDLCTVDGIYSGMLSAARRFGVRIVGGDTSSSSRLVLDVSMIGDVRAGELVPRSGARPGDVIMVTGKLGGSFKGRHLRFTPRLAESRFLVKNFRIHSMIDVSDGLSGDLAHICRASRVGARIYESLIPLSKEAHTVKNALNDGEDYELLFTVSGRIFTHLLRRFGKKFTTPLAVIGEITKKRGIIITGRDGRSRPLAGGGFRHF